MEQNTYIPNPIGLQHIQYIHNTIFVQKRNKNCKKKAFNQQYGFRSKKGFDLN